jgi:hypothetical protein
MKITFDIEDESDAHNAINRLFNLADLFRVEADPELQAKLLGLTLPDAALASDGAVGPSQIRAEAPSAVVKTAKKRSPAAKPAVQHTSPPAAPTEPGSREEMNRLAVGRGIVWASRVMAEHGAKHIADLTDDQLQAALDAA